MRRSVAVLGVCAAAVAVAQSAKPLSNLTVSLTPDAGVNAVVQNPVTVQSVQNPVTVGTVTNPISVQDVVDPVRVVGPTNGNVFVSGTVDLSSASLGSLGVVTCTHGEQQRISVGTTPSLMPPNLPDGGAGYLSRRTNITLVNVGSIQNVACRVDPGDGGLPNCTTPGYGATLFNNGGTVSFNLLDDATPVRCVACLSTSSVEVLEAACTAP